MNGFREGRSPDVLAVADGTPVVTEVDGSPTPWPAVAAAADPRVPIVFAGAGTTKGASVPDGTTLDRIAPTVAEALGFEREHPEVRSGKAVAGVADGRRPRLVLLVGWRGVGSSELENHMNDWPFLSIVARRWRRDARRGRRIVAARPGRDAHDDRDRRSAVAARHHRLVRPERRGAGRAGVRARRAGADHRDARRRSRRRGPFDARWAGGDRRARSRDRRRPLVPGRGPGRRGDRRQRDRAALGPGASHDGLRSGRRPRRPRGRARRADPFDGSVDARDRDRGRARHVGLHAGRRGGHRFARGGPARGPGSRDWSPPSRTPFLETRRRSPPPSPAACSWTRPCCATSR